MNYTAFQDITFITSIIGLVNLFGNIFWGLKLRSVQGSKELMESLTAINAAKDEVIKSKDDKIKALKEERKQLSYQYQEAITLNQKLEGEIKTYKEFHNHPLAS